MQDHRPAKKFHSLWSFVFIIEKNLKLQTSVDGSHRRGAEPENLNITLLTKIESL